MSPTGEGSTPSRLDSVLDGFEFSSTHSIAISAPPETVYAALFAVTAAEIRTTRMLMGLRALPARLRRRQPDEATSDGPLIEQFVANGFFSWLGQDPPHEIVLGMIGQPWKLSGGAPVTRFDLPTFRAFAEPGYARIAWNFELRPRDGGTLVSTTTRIAMTDEASRRSFGRYWFVVRHGSGLVRRDILRAVKCRAER